MLEGLREERQLWGRELAQQGAELAQDRGRMEAQIEALSNETTTLRSELQVELYQDHRTPLTFNFTTEDTSGPMV